MTNLLQNISSGIQAGFLGGGDEGGGGESLKSVLNTIQRAETSGRGLDKLASYLKGKESWLERGPASSAITSALSGLNPAVNTLGCLYLL